MEMVPIWMLFLGGFNLFANLLTLGLVFMLVMRK